MHTTVVLLSGFYASPLQRHQGHCVPWPHVKAIANAPLMMVRPTQQLQEKEELTRRLWEVADYWVGMCSAITLTNEAGLQPFAVPSGWMGSSSPPPAQAFTNAELTDEVERCTPALHALINAAVDRAPSLCRRSSMLPLARLACWTDSERWVRPLDDWVGEEPPDTAAVEAEEAAAAQEAAADKTKVDAAVEAAMVAAQMADLARAEAEAAMIAAADTNSDGNAEEEASKRSLAIQLGGKASRLRQEAARLRFEAANLATAAKERADAAAEAAAKPRETAALRSLASHLLERWPTPQALHGALTLTDGSPVSEASHRISRAFLQVQVAAGSGDAPVLAMLRSQISGAISKAAAKEFVKLGGGGGSMGVEVGDDEGEGSCQQTQIHPLHALRVAQIRSLGGEAWVGEAACKSRLGAALLLSTTKDDKASADTTSNEGPSETYALTCLDWVVRHQGQLESPCALRFIAHLGSCVCALDTTSRVHVHRYVASSLVDFFLEMRTIDPSYTCVGRTPKTVSAAFEAFTASTVTFDPENE